ncbi:MAG: MaoC family dehydratase N-terminal domain-containing protein [Propionicimonas sp.]|uniref:FAS1-like dehydratase domain-containing protein n=1 Tax=Propionicimonas sp. TaxID=1955623 RepID=UPI003D144419
MPISEEHIGRTYPATAPYEVGRAKISEFAAALGDADNPAYSGTDPVAPPTFAVVLASAAWGAMFDDPELGLSLSRTVHVDQRFAWTRPLRAGDEVTATLTIEKVRARGTTAIIGIAVALSTTDGEALCTASSTLMHTSEEDAA